MSRNVKLLQSLLPLLLFVVIVVFLLKGLQHDPTEVPSPLLNKPAPEFTALSLTHPDRPITSAIFQGEITILNVFASWCLYCHSEHPILMDIAKLKQVQLVGLNYKDQAKKAKAWLKEYGNPYKVIIADPVGKIAITFGVYGTPETFILDRNGIIRYKQAGPISPLDWKKKIWPFVQRLMKEKR